VKSVGSVQLYLSAGKIDDAPSVICNAIIDNVSRVVCVRFFSLLAP
jgi:hypothetical protein